MRLRILLVCCAALALAVGVATATAGGGSNSANALAKPQTFNLLSVESGSETEIGGFGFQREPVPGDRFTFTDQLYKWAGIKRGAHVGHLDGLCTFTKIKVTSNSFHATAQCNATFFLPAGQVAVEGFIPIPEGPLNFVLPVVGGTGVYANARGTVHIRDLGNGETGKSNNEFRLLP
jgi:Allene oxide cyclase barrel like domain